MTVTVPWTVEEAAGAVRVAVGGVVSGKGDVVTESGAERPEVLPAAS